ncbi:MAG: ABC transporter permease subunit, partial [Lachnospiraceae bacterium]|nr:ABC transporter permease subunit [Lachnospiraceae bacterium]
ITIGFVIPILFAILINELRNGIFKRSVQTISYLPHFISWVVAAGMISQMLATNGPVNDLLLALGLMDKPIPFLGEGEMFWGIITASDIWKEVGWNAIIFLAAITGVDTALYEAADVDGAGRFQKIWHITLPSIMNVIIVILIMNIGWLVNVGFERQMLLGSPQIREWAEVLDVYVLRFGIGMGRYSYGTAIGIFRSLVSIFLLFSANYTAKRMGRGGVV